MLEEMKLEQQRRLENALEKTPRAWTSLGSENEVDLFTIKDSRPYVRYIYSEEGCCLLEHFAKVVLQSSRGYASSLIRIDRSNFFSNFLTIKL